VPGAKSSGSPSMKRTMVAASAGSARPTAAAAVRLNGSPCGSNDWALSQPPAWTRRSCTVTSARRGSGVAPVGGAKPSSGTTFASSESVPASTRVSTATAVIALVVLAMRKREVGRTASPRSTSARP